jgi:DNA modification methylase
MRQPLPNIQTPQETSNRVNIETWLIKNLTLDPNNARKHDQKNLDAIKASLEKFGQRKPIVVTAEGTVLAGNGTVTAAKALGWTDITVAVAPADWDADTAKAYALADNRSAELAEWDQGVLASQLVELDVAGWDLAGLGFDVPEPEETETVEDEPVEVDDTPAISKLGDIYQLGSHRLMCGSSTDLATVSKLMNGVKADMVFTDPPYNTGMSSEKNSGSTRLNHMFNDDYTDQEWAEFMRDFTKTLDSFTKDDSALYVCFAWKRNHELVPHLTDKFKLSNIIVWDKVVHGLGSDYQYTYEIINVCKKGKPSIDSHQGTDREYQDVWRIQRVMGRNEDHATAKPLELCARAIRHATKQGDVVLDIFGGSGSTLIAAEQTNRACYMMELDPKYVDVIVKRWENLTGKKAELINE